MVVILKILIKVSLVALLIFLILSFVPIPKSLNMPSWFVTTRINNILRKYGKYTSHCSVAKKEKLDWCIKTTNENRQNLSNMGSNDVVMDLSFKGWWGLNYSKPIELYSIFESFLYLKDRALPYNVVAVVCISQSGKWFDANSTTVIITTKEFENLYNSIDSKNKSNSNIAKELSDVWMNNNSYNRYELELTEQQQYRRLIVTPWSNIKKSFDGNFSIIYSYDNNNLSINKVDKSKHNDVSITSSSNIQKMYIDEDGFLYGAWDKQNNIWLYGEKTGISLYKFDGDKNWNQSDYTDEYQIPYSLKMIKEAKIKSR
jgi:hypothetical protein